MIEEVTGDLFASDLPALAHGCNCRGVMGAGIARQFAKRWPAMYDEYRKWCRTGQLIPGRIMTWQAPSGVTVFNLATQLDPGPTATLEAIGQSVTRMVRVAGASGIPAVGLPRIGCGIGGLDWDEVKRVLTWCQLPSVRLVVYTLPPREAVIELSSPEVPEIDPRVRDVFDTVMEKFGPSPRQPEPPDHVGCPDDRFKSCPCGRGDRNLCQIHKSAVSANAETRERLGFRAERPDGRTAPPPPFRYTAPDGREYRSDFGLLQRLADDREPCDYDYDGLRRCCGTLHLAAHEDDCPVTPGLRDAMIEHERTFRHANEAR